MTLSRRPRRPNRFRRNRNQGAQPKFQIGDQTGEFNILQYLGYMAFNPVTLIRLSQEHHWYKVRCSCGSEVTETHSQQQLIDTRRIRACVTCIKQIVQNKETV